MPALCFEVDRKYFENETFLKLWGFDKELYIAAETRIFKRRQFYILSLVAKIDFNPRVSRTSLHRNLGKEKNGCTDISQRFYQATNILLLLIYTQRMGWMV